MARVVGLVDVVSLVDAFVGPIVVKFLKGSSASGFILGGLVVPV